MDSLADKPLRKRKQQTTVERNIQMNRKIKALGLALVAALALTAVMASTAAANFTSSAAHTTLHGVQQGEGHQFTAGEGIGAINCKTATFSGTATGTSVSTVTIKPTYENCKDSLGRVVHITKNTLEYHFLSTASKGFVTMTGEIELTVTTSFGHCTILIQGHRTVNGTTVPDQTINGITYAQSGNDLLVTTHSNNITSIVEGSGFACGTTKTHQTNGTYIGSTLMKGNGGAAKISVH
jgi:hypothetical protein